MYKVYDQNSENSLIVTTLAEVQELTGGTSKQVRSAFYHKFTTINGFSVINYSI